MVEISAFMLNALIPFNSFRLNPLYTGNLRLLLVINGGISIIQYVMLYFEPSNNTNK